MEHQLILIRLFAITSITLSLADLLAAKQTIERLHQASAKQTNQYDVVARLDFRLQGDQILFPLISFYNGL